MTLLDDVHRQFPADQRLQHPSHVAGDGPPAERDEVAKGDGDAFRRQLVVLLALAVGLIAILFSVPAPEVPHPIDAINKSTTSAPLSKDAIRPRPGSREDVLPCSDLDYAYEKC